MFVLNSITAHRWTHKLPVALLVVGAFVGTQLARIVADIVARRRGWSIAAALATGAVMVWLSIQAWMSSVPWTGTAALDGTLLLVVLMASAMMMAIVETGAQLAKGRHREAAARPRRAVARWLIGRTGGAAIHSSSTRLVSARHLWCTVTSPVCPSDQHKESR